MRALARVLAFSVPLARCQMQRSLTTHSLDVDRSTMKAVLAPKDSSAHTATVRGRPRAARRTAGPKRRKSICCQSRVRNGARAARGDAGRGPRLRQVILSHGLGDTSQGWLDAAAFFAQALPHTKFVLPTAPTQVRGAWGYGWRCGAPGDRPRVRCSR